MSVTKTKLSLLHSMIGSIVDDPFQHLFYCVYKENQAVWWWMSQLLGLGFGSKASFCLFHRAGKTLSTMHASNTLINQSGLILTASLRILLGKTSLIFFIRTLYAVPEGFWSAQRKVPSTVLTCWFVWHVWAYLEGSHILRVSRRSQVF